MTELMSEWGGLAGMIIASIFTIMVLSYLIGDNVLFRLASHIFVGLSAGYVTVLIVYGVIWQQLIAPIFSPNAPLDISMLIGLIMGFLLLLGRSSGVGRPIVAYLVGVGAATAIGGALFGTILPQVNATANLFDAQGMPLLMAAAALIGMTTTLVYFNFRAKAIGDLPAQRQFWIEALGLGGQFFVAVTFGVLFASLLTATLTAFVQRFDFLLNFFEFLAGFFSLT
jgi:hypothetical protein